MVNALGKVEWPTVGLGLLIYGGWLAVTALHHHLPPPLWMGLAAILVAWHGSLQHECIHGHPTPWRRFNALFAGPPLALWLPYEAYRASHLSHHRSQLTSPTEDPESYYIDPGRWRDMAQWRRTLHRTQQTMAGRLLLGPWLAAIRVWRAPRLWLGYVAGLAAVVWWLTAMCEIGLVTYLLWVVWPGTALMLVRSFAEHSAYSTSHTAIVATNRFWGILFLNNNLHVVHHDRPDLPWYALPREFAEWRQHYLQRASLIEGYGSLWRRFAFRPREPILHPGGPR